MVMRAGFTLTEVVVAMTLLCVAGLGVAATGLVAVQSFARAEQQEHLLSASEALLDSLLTLPQNSAGARSLPYGRLEWNAADSTGIITVQATPLRGAAFELAGSR